MPSTSRTPSSRPPRAVVKHRRTPWEGYGLDDLPSSTGRELVLKAGVLGDAKFRSSNGTHHVEEGVRMGTPYLDRRALTWDLNHPRDRAVVEALRDPSVSPWEFGWLLALDHVD